MYGRENSEVVKPTNAVSATRKTLNGSMRNWRCSTRSGPPSITRIVSAAAASSVQKLAAAFTVGANERWPISARSSVVAFPQLFEVLEVEAVELLANLEEEDAEDQHADEHVERDAELDDHRHTVRGARRREEQAVLHRQEADHLRDGLAPRDHHQERKHDARHRDPERRARHGVRELRDRQRQV